MLNADEVELAITLADAETRTLLAQHPLRGFLGFENIYYDRKRRILKEKYGVEWNGAVDPDAGSYD